MKTRLYCRLLCVALWAIVFTGLAQTDEDSANRIGLSYRGGFNVKASYKNVGQPGQPGGPSVTGLSYEDGFVRPNSQPNDLGLSWNWGYQNASQIFGDNIVMTSSQHGKLANDQEHTPINGMELLYNRRLGFWGKAAWGLEGALNYTYLDLVNNVTPAPTVMRADAFNLGGSIPPVAPYAGTPDGPGILISDTPVAASLTVHTKTETTMAGLRLGPYIEWPISEGFGCTFSAGFALAWADTDLSVREQVTLDGTQAVTRSGSGSESEWLPGWYVAGTLTARVYKSAGIFAGVQFQDVGKTTVRALDKEVKLDFSQAVFVTAGLNFSF